MKEFNAIVEELMKDIIYEDIAHPSKYGKDVNDGCYLKIINKNKLSQTIVNIIKKLKLRYLNEDGMRTEDFFSIAMEKVVECFFYTYIGHIKLNGISVDIPRVNSKDIDEIKHILESETDEEKEYRLMQFAGLFTKDNIDRYLSIVYNQCINRDYDDNYKTNKLQKSVLIERKVLKDENGFREDKIVYMNLTYESFEEDYRLPNDNHMNMVDYLYSTGNAEIQELCKDNVQNNINETSGLYEYILDRYFNELTNSQKKFLEYAVKQDEKFLKKGDSTYSRQNVYSYKEYIQSKIFHLIREDEDSLIYITNDNKISWKRTNATQDTIKRILSEESKEVQIDMLISALNKDSKTSEIIVNHLLDADLYRPCCQLILGKMNRYKFKVIYMNKILDVLKTIK